MNIQKRTKELSSKLVPFEKFKNMNYEYKYKIYNHKNKGIFVIELF